MLPEIYAVYKLIRLTKRTSSHLFPKRHSSASATVYVGNQLADLIRENAVPKGDLLAISQIGGIIAGKRAAFQLLPFVDSANINCNCVKVSAKLNATTNEIIVRSTVKRDCETIVRNCDAEALTSVIFTSLSIYYMGKKVTHDIRIRNVQLELEWKKTRIFD